VAWKISIFLLLGLVFGIVASFVTYVVRMMRREERERIEREKATQPQGTPPPQPTPPAP
jgi:hypothetical protein